MPDLATPSLHLQLEEGVGPGTNIPYLNSKLELGRPYQARGSRFVIPQSNLPDYSDHTQRLMPKVGRRPRSRGPGRFTEFVIQRATSPDPAAQSLTAYAGGRAEGRGPKHPISTARVLNTLLAVPC